MNGTSRLAKRCATRFAAYLIRSMQAVVAAGAQARSATAWARCLPDSVERLARLRRGCAHALQRQKLGGPHRVAGVVSQRRRDVEDHPTSDPEQRDQVRGDQNTRRRPPRRLPPAAPAERVCGGRCEQASPASGPRPRSAPTPRPRGRSAWRRRARCARVRGRARPGCGPTGIAAGARDAVCGTGRAQPGSSTLAACGNTPVWQRRARHPRHGILSDEDSRSVSS